MVSRPNEHVCRIDQERCQAIDQKTKEEGSSGRNEEVDRDVGDDDIANRCPD
jgi:hypothetical protein